MGAAGQSTLLRRRCCGSRGQKRRRRVHGQQSSGPVPEGNGWLYCSYGPQSNVRSMVHVPPAISLPWPPGGPKSQGRKKEGAQHGSRGYRMGNSLLRLVEPILSRPHYVPWKPDPLGKQERRDRRHRIRKATRSFGTPLRSNPSKRRRSLPPGIQRGPGEATYQEFRGGPRDVERAAGGPHTVGPLTTGLRPQTKPNTP